MYFIVTVDTEADIQKKGSDRAVLSNLASLPRFQALCEAYNVMPTYLITYEVATHRETVENLKNWQDKGMAEVGTHLHPWTNPPIGTMDGELRFPHRLSDKEWR